VASLSAQVLRAPEKLARNRGLSRAARISLSVSVVEPATILIVDDEPAACAALSAILTADGHLVRIAGEAGAALEQVEQSPPDLVLTDLHMPGMSGLELLRELKRRSVPAPVILMTASSATETAVTAMKEGAADYLTKPLNMDELSIVVARALEATRLQKEAAALKNQVQDLARFDNIIGSSPEIQAVFQKVTQVAPSRATVLLTGETGTGKELVAAAIHYRSPRAAAPFVRVHCGALADSLLESELFGHERGSFTGAARQRQGRFEQANGGTLMLDEVGEISAATQVKLLRVLQEREFERVGGNETIRVDVRVIAATHRDLKQMVAAGAFREDLFYRLNVINLRLPGLRERVSDIPILLRHFLDRFAAADEKPHLEVTDAALQLLTRYPWPGNVRELENVIQGAVVLANEGLIEPHHLPPEIARFTEQEPGLPVIPGASILDFERYAILKTLEATGGSTSKTARLLGISVRKIQYRLQAYRNGRGAGSEPPASGRRSAIRAAH
jgi:DNA-binding NtrC family response regulator